MTRIILNGYLGQMGSVITRLAEKRNDISIAAGVDACTPHKTMPFPVFLNINDCDMPADVIIDFSVAAAVDSVIDYAIDKKIPAVICTTGLSDITISKINNAAKTIAVFKSGNMSLGINLIAEVLRRVSKTLYDEGFDVEIIEKHHNRKVDAPSGTAYMLADAVNEPLAGSLRVVTDRSETREKRKTDELGISAIRGGTIVGQHSVIFAGLDEVIEFSHSAFSREVFAVGALKAAVFMKGKPPGHYDMRNVTEEM